MILTQIAGGLGNQMFQYACGQALAARLDTQLKLDLSWFGHQNLRHYGLDVFNIVEDVATPAEINDAQAKVQKPAGIRSFWRWLQSDWHHFPEHQMFVYDPAIERLTTGKNVYLTGYWQSEKYFADQTASIRNAFKPRQPLSPENQELAAEMQNRQSVSVHVRRGDYINDPHTSSLHLVCTLQYYQTAMQHISNTIDTPDFYIFSDDPAWCAENLHSDYPITIMSNNQTPAHHELLLRSYCQHHILSNSSFSWWGVWLNYNMDKRIIVPDQWLPGQKTMALTVIPKQWNVTVLASGGDV